jgi:hypothetical protein
MSELTLILLRFGLLFVLWAFVFAIVYSLRTDLFGQRVRRMPEQQAVSAAFAPAPVASAPDLPTVASEVASSDSATKLVITSGPKVGTELALPNEPLTIGRSSESGLVIRDDYTSTHHARLMRWSDGQWVVQDLDSTNGTFLDGVRVSLPTPVPLGTPVRIGTTTFELQR